MNKKYLAIIYSLWLLVNIFLWLKLGINTDGDAKVYLIQSDNLISLHQYNGARLIPYSVYVFFISAIRYVFHSLFFVCLFQLLINGLALFYFYKILLISTKQSIVPLIGCLLLVICYQYQSWNTALYTESFYCSLLILFLYHYLKPVYTKKNILWLCILYVLLLFCRPTTIILSIPLLVSMIYRLFKLRNLSKGKIALIFITFFILLNVLLYFLLDKFNVVEEYMATRVICGATDTGKELAYTLPPSDMNEYFKMIYFIFTNKLTILKLSWQRLISFFTMTRAYYTLTHNLLLIIFDCFYFFVIFHRPSTFFDIYKRILIYGTVIIFSLHTMLTCDEWSGRWVVPIIPFIVLIISNGIDNFITKYKLVKTHQ